MVEPADMPIVKTFIPERAGEDVKERMKAVQSQLSSAKQRELGAMLTKYGAKAMIIAPELNEARQADTGAELVLYVLKGQPPMTDHRLNEIAREAGDIIGAGTTPNAYLFGRDSAQEIGQSFKVRGGEPNPVTHVFHELDSRPAGLAKANA